MNSTSKNAIETVNSFITWENLNKIDSFLTEISTQTERVEVIMQDLTDGYFAMRPECLQEEDNRFKICCQYNEYSVKADIVGDYLLKIDKIVNTANQWVNSEFEKQKKLKISEQITTKQQLNKKRSAI